MSEDTKHPTLEDYKKEFVPEISKCNFLDKITNTVYLGDIDGASQYDFFKREGITHVVSLVGYISPTYTPEQNLTQKKIDVNDFPTENIIKYFKECIEFMDKAIKTYVHCAAGVSRSTTIVVAYLMWKTRSSFEDVLEYVREKRKWASPNMGFREQLVMFEKLLKDNDYDLNKIDFENIKWEKNINDFSFW